MSAPITELPREGGRGGLRALLAFGGAALALGGWVLWHRTPAPLEPSRPGPALPTRLAPESLSTAEAEREAAPVEGAYSRQVERPRPVQNLAAEADPPSPAAPPPAGPRAFRGRDGSKPLPEIFHMPPQPDPPAPASAPSPAHPPAAAAAGGAFAPFGRLVKCALVGTLDSVTARSEPIEALVTEDLDWNGRVIIPAGTEAYSYARPDAVIDARGVGRLVDNGEWTLVLPGERPRANGRELILRARALDRQETVVDARGKAEAWGIDDGAAGLIGATVSTLDNREIKLFAAASLAAMAAAVAPVVERQQAATGIAGVLGATQVAPTLGNAAAASLGGGTQAVLGEIASRIRQEVEKRGVYVRVPAGKAFYLFVEQTIDPGAAAVGLRLPGRREGAP